MQITLLRADAVARCVLSTGAAHVGQTSQAKNETRWGYP